MTVVEILYTINNKELKFMMTSASQSNSGASAYFGFLYALLGSIHSNQLIIADAQFPNSASAWLSGVATGGDANLIMQANAGAGSPFWITASTNMLKIGKVQSTEPSTGVINIDVNANMAIGGNPTSNYLLNVYGNVRANQVTVNTTGADFVFDTAYKLPSLRQLENYIHANHHLPNITPEKQKQQEGVNLGDNQTQLLQKVEELTLYIIQQNKKIIQQDKKMAQMQAQIDALKKRRK